MNLANLVLRHAQARPSHTALEFASRKISYADYTRLAGKIAAALVAHGVKQGDRVLYYSRNNPEFLITYTACAWIGAIFAPVHHGFKSAELEYVAENADARVAFVEQALLEEYAGFSENLPGLPTDVVILPDGTDTPPVTNLTVTGFDDAVSASGQIPDIVDVPDETPVLICYTSGSTSKPKPVLRSHRSEAWNAETYHRYWDLRTEDRMLMALPLSWVYGLSTLGQALLAAGSTIEILTHFNPVTVVNAITTNKATLFGGANTMYVKMLDVYDRLGGDFSSLRNCYIGGEPSNDAVVERFEAIIGSRLWQGYAATEAAPVILTDPRRDREAPRHTVGRLVPGAEIKLVDENHRPVLTGEPGEAYFRCPGSMLCYYKEPGLTAERVTEDGWFKTGDLVLEHEGYYFVVGRMIDMIIRGGSNVAPAEVESALGAIPGILDAVVFGLPDEEYGERVAAAITTAADGDFSDLALTAALSERLAAFKTPTVYFRNLDLPDGKTGKRDRKAVREMVLTTLRASA